MTERERHELARLNRKWAMGKADTKQMLRALALQRQADHEADERSAWVEYRRTLVEASR